MERPNWAPEDVDLDRPSVARVYDYYLGGSHNFAADRAFAEQVLRAMPQVRQMAQINRAFLCRAVRFLAEQGVRQFVDLGSGIPTVGNVHEIAQEIDPDTRVAYVDIDPVAVMHSRAILADIPNTAVIAGDLRKPVDILADPELTKLIDFTRPVAFMLIAVFHFIPDELRPADIVAAYAAAAVPGSYVAITHAGLDRPMTEQESLAYAAYRNSPNPVILRTRAEVRALLGDLTVLEPGVVEPSHWRPDPADELTPTDIAAGSAGVARKD